MNTNGHQVNLSFKVFTLITVYRSKKNWEMKTWYEFGAKVMRALHGKAKGMEKRSRFVTHCGATEL